MAVSPDGREPLPESEEQEIKQVRSRNKVIRVLDSQSADLYDRQPDADAPVQQSGAKHGGDAAPGADGGQRCTSDKQHGWPAKQLHGAPGNNPTAIYTSPDSLQAPAKPPGERGTGIRLPCPPMGMPMTIPCVFVSSQQGSQSCSREQLCGAGPAGRSEPGSARVPAATPQQAPAASPSNVAGKAPDRAARKPHVDQSTSAPNARTASASAALGSNASDSGNGGIPRRQSAPVGGDWQLRPSKGMNNAAGRPAAPVTRGQPVAAGTPGRQNRAAACELSPGGGVRRSARIAAHNIAPAADGDRAFGAIGALSQCFSPGFAGVPVTPSRPSGSHGATVLFAQLYSSCTAYTEIDNWRLPRSDVYHRLEVSGCPAAGLTDAPECG